MIELCGGLRNAGALRASDAEIRALGVNVVMITTYWMSFQRLSRAVASGAEDDPAGMHFEHAVSQVLALLAPYLHGPHRALVERLGARYLDDGVAHGHAQSRRRRKGVNVARKWGKFPHTDASYAYRRRSAQEGVGPSPPGRSRAVPEGCGSSRRVAAVPRRRLPAGGRNRSWRRGRRASTPP